MTPQPSDALAATTAAGYAKRIRCMPGTAPANCQRAIAATAFRARAIHGCDDRRWMMSQSTELGPCSRCGKREGEFINSGRTRFRYYESRDLITSGALWRPAWVWSQEIYPARSAWC